VIARKRGQINIIKFKKCVVSFVTIHPRNSGQWLRQLQQQYSGKLIPGHRISLDLLNGLDAPLFNYLFLF